MNKQWGKAPLPSGDCVQAAPITNVALRVLQPPSCCSTGEHVGALVWQSCGPFLSTVLHTSPQRWLVAEKKADWKTLRQDGISRTKTLMLPLLASSLSPDSFSQSREGHSEHLMLQSRCVKQVGLNTFLTILFQCPFSGRGRL